MVTRKNITNLFLLRKTFPTCHFCPLSQCPTYLFLLAIFVSFAEAAARGARQAQTEDVTRVEVEHVEKILPQLV